MSNDERCISLETRRDAQNVLARIQADHAMGHAVNEGRLWAAVVILREMVDALDPKVA